MRSRLVLAFILLCGVTPFAQTGESLPQGGASQPATDPMTDKTYAGYVNTGYLLNEKVAAHVSILCSGGKLWRSTLSVDGMSFHADFYASLRNTEVSYAAIKVGSKIDHKGFLLSKDLHQASLSKDEVKTLLKAVTPIIQFSDAFGTTHYASFDMSSPPTSLGSDCGYLAHN